MHWSLTRDRSRMEQQQSEEIVGNGQYRLRRSRRPSPQQTDGRISKHSRPRRETETKAATKTARIGPSPPLFLPLPPLLERHFATLHNYLQCHFVSEAVVYFLRYLSMVRDKNNCCGAKICQGHPTRIQAQFVPRAAPALSRSHQSHPRCGQDTVHPLSLR